MGNSKSKSKVGVRGKGKRQKYGASSQQDIRTIGLNEVHDQEYEDMELKLLRSAILRDPDSFVLNNLMMCVQFFGNYEEEIEHVKNTLVSCCETELNKRLPQQRHVLLPDVLQEHVARHVGFTSTRQTSRPTIEPLQPVRIYVVHDDIEVTEQNNPPHYSSVNDTVTYNMLLKPSDHQGYVKLQLLEEMSSLRNASTEEDLSSIAEDDYEFYSDGDSVYGPKPSSRVSLSRHGKKHYSQSSRHSHSRSLPDLQQDGISYEERRRLSRDSIYDGYSAQNIKAESDYEHLSSNDDRRMRDHRAWSKRESATKLMNPRGVRPRSHRQHSRSSGGQNNRSPASSTSSGYRSGNYAVDSDTDCSYNANYKTRSCNGSISCASNGYGSTHGREPNNNGCAHGCGSHIYNGGHGCNPANACNGCCAHRCGSPHACTHHEYHPPPANGMSQSCEVIANGDSAPHLPEPPKVPKSVSPQQTVPLPPLQSGIPRNCFKKVTYTSEGKVYDPREERKQLLNSKQRRIRMALRRHDYDVYYFNSARFMDHFINLFEDQYADALQFDRDAVVHAKPEGCVIYCDKVMVSYESRHSRIEPYEVIPTAFLKWPECAQEWLDRPRSTWPNYDDIKKIEDFGCYVVPEGFQPKNGINPNQDLQWQLTFPAAERYLETCMTHTQVQVYLIALMLHKTFIRPVFDTIFGLTTAHIRNKLFWMIEENDRPTKWPENRSGECLLKLLNSLYYCISQNEPTLPDYFVRDRNLFQKVPSEHLLHTQKQLKRIIENPVMYVFHAMENVRHSQKFFPRPDYEMLLRILTVDTLALVNPALNQHVFRPVSPPPTDDGHVIIEDDIEERTYRPGGFWDSAKMKKEKPKLYSATPVTKKTLINPRKATDSIIEISVRCADLEGPRLCALLDFFVRHFMKMAEQCHKYRAHPQKAVYLNQADLLSILLSEHSRYKDDARAYRDKIRALRNRTAPLRTQNDDPPETPKRNAEAPIYVAPLKDRFAREAVEPTLRSDSVNYAQSVKDYSRDDRIYGSTTADVYVPMSEDSYDVRLGLGKISKDRESYRSTSYLSSDTEVKRFVDPTYDKGGSKVVERSSSSLKIVNGEAHKKNTSSSGKKVSSDRESTRAQKMGNGESSRKLTSPTRGISSSRVGSPVDGDRSYSQISSNGRHMSDSRKLTPTENVNSKKTAPPLRNSSASRNDSMDNDKNPRVVSLIENQDESFLTETTYI